MRVADSERLRALIENAPFPMTLRDMTGRFVAINKLGAELLEHPPDELRGHSAREVFDEATAECIDRHEESVRAGGEAVTFELLSVLPDGSSHDFLVAKYPVRDPGGELIGVGGISIDITARKQVENMLREAESRFRGAFGAAAIGMAIVAPDGGFIEVNPALCELVGYSEAELLAVGFQQITHPEDVDADLELVERMLADEIRTYQLEKRYVRRDGEIVWARLSVTLVRDAAGAPVQFVSQIEDISQRKRADELAEQLRHAQKLDALGRLAGGVAHDFNNMLTAIQGYSQLLLDALPPDDRLRRNAEQIHRAAEQAAALPRQLLAFSRKQPRHATVVDINGIVSRAGDMLRQLLGDSITLDVETHDEPALALVDAGHVEQVLLNLVVNAAEAMPDGGDVRVWIRADRVGRDAPVELDRPPGPYIVLAVEDEGHGMHTDTKARIFEPFFTTKPAGSGLGLSTVYGIVLQSEGFLRVATTPDEGTLIEAWLPRSFLELTDGEGGETLEDEPGEASILIVEDEDLVRELAVAVLEGAGYRVRAAESGDEALELLRVGVPDVLLADMMMPGMTGRELAGKVLAAHPDMRVILMSGYSEEPPGLEGYGAGAETFLQKPFAPQLLLETVGNALAERPGRLAEPAARSERITFVSADLEDLIGSSQTLSERSPLTSREREVLGLVAEGLTNEKAASALGISAETVQSHVRNVMAKLGAETRTQAVAIAFRRALLV